jgi:hypothetical protein
MGPRGAFADVASDHPAAILVFPKLIVDTSGGLDTVVRISNVSETELDVYCFYVNATPKCSLGIAGATSCFPNRSFCSFPGLTDGKCEPFWQETDFLIQLTKDQPTGWLVSGGEGLGCQFFRGVCSNDGTTSCAVDSECPSRHCVLPPCLPLDGNPGGRIGFNGQTNEGVVPVSPQDPFIGELKCIAVDNGQRPIARNDLIGEVIIGRQETGPRDSIDVSGYNAIGIPAIEDVCQENKICSLTGTSCANAPCVGVNDRDKTLVLGGPTEDAEYQGCPNILILDHYFDGAIDPTITNVCQLDGTCSVTGIACANDNECIDNICRALSCTVTGTPCVMDADCANTCDPDNLCTLSGEHCVHDEDCTDPTFKTRVATDLTLVPCTEDFENQRPEISKTAAQFLVFNEFEQRLSTSTSVECFKEIRLSSIDTSPDDRSRSIFSAGVAGTLTGQTRIRGAEGQGSAGPGIAGNGLLGIAEEFRCGGPKYQFPLCGYVDQPERLLSAAAKNLHIQGRRPQADFIYLPGAN